MPPPFSEAVFLDRVLSLMLTNDPADVVMPPPLAAAFPAKEMFIKWTVLLSTKRAPPSSEAVFSDRVLSLILTNDPAAV
jgi:hypothetical protein